MLHSNYREVFKLAKIDKHFNYLGLNSESCYDYLNKRENVTNNILYMLNRTNCMFDYEGLPDSIPKKELERILQTNGYAVIGEVEGNFYALTGGLGGEYDVYNRPTEIVISEPYLNYNATWKLGKDCVLIKNDNNMMGLLPLFGKYCTLLNENEITMLLATVNKRVETLISANDDSTIESARVFLSDIFAGKLGIIAESSLFDSLKVNRSGQMHSDMKDLFEFHQYLKASMFNEIGLNANFNMKRERLTANEVEMNSDNLYPAVDDMLSCRREGLEQLKELFNIEVEVELNSSWDYRVLNGEPIKSNTLVNEGSKQQEEQFEQEEPIIELLDESEETDDPTDEPLDETEEQEEPVEKSVEELEEPVEKQEEQEEQEEKKEGNK